MDAWRCIGLGNRAVRRAAEPDLLGNRKPRTRLEQRRPRRLESLQRLRGGARRGYRKAEMVLPVLAARRLRFRFRSGAGPRRYGVEGQNTSGDALGQPQWLLLRARPDHRRVSTRQAIRQSYMGHG